MSRRLVGVAAVAACMLALRPGEAAAQISLADDIITAAQAKQSSQKQRSSALGRSLGTAESPYRRRPGTADVSLGAAPPRRASLPKLARLPTSASAFGPLPQEPGTFEHGVAPPIERLPLPLQADSVAGRIEDPAGYDDDGPTDGLTLDDAIRRLVASNRDLRIKALELPQADADVLTAGLRDNPLLFYGTDDVAYGSYSPDRPGEVEHGISVVMPIDYMGKRGRRIALATEEKRVLVAQYQDAVRVAIDELYTAYVNALVARQALRAAEDSLVLVDEVLAAYSSRHASASTDAEREQLDDLTVERGVTDMAVQDARDRYDKAKHQLADLLEIPQDAVESMDLRGRINVRCPPLPSLDGLIATARERRPDLIAHRLGVSRARAEWDEERSERFSDAYFLFTPMNYLDRSQSHERSVNTWGAGVFVTLPLFNRNQGNVRRAEINVVQSQVESEVLESQAEGEVRHAYTNLVHSLQDLERLEKETLPAVRRKRDRAKARLRSREIHTEDFLKVERQTTSLVRFYRDTAARNRRNMLRLNTAVGCRLLP